MTEATPARDGSPAGATVDDRTGLLNREGFEPLAEHRFRLSDRTREPVTLVVLRLAPSVAAAEGADADLTVEVARVIGHATREADLTARLDGDAFCVLLAGDASGAEATVLSRIVQGIAERNARSDRPVPLAVAIGTASYEPGSRRSLDDVLIDAASTMQEQERSGEPPR